VHNRRALQGCWCYKGVTRVLQACYTRVTSVLQACYKRVTSVLLGAPERRSAGMQHSHVRNTFIVVITPNECATTPRVYSQACSVTRVLQGC
jgi:hypothetical protein